MAGGAARGGVRRGVRQHEVFFFGLQPRFFASVLWSPSSGVDPDRSTGVSSPRRVSGLRSALIVAAATASASAAASRGDEREERRGTEKRTRANCAMEPAAANRAIEAAAMEAAANYRAASASGRRTPADAAAEDVVSLEQQLAELRDELAREQASPPLL